MCDLTHPVSKIKHQAIQAEWIALKILEDGGEKLGWA